MIFSSTQSAQLNGEDFKDKHPISGREKHIKILYVYVSKLENSNNLSSSIIGAEERRGEEPRQDSYWNHAPLRSVMMLSLRSFFRDTNTYTTDAEHSEPEHAHT